MGVVAESLRAKLSAAFSPALLQVDDECARHAGHAGAREGGESHFNVVIEAAAFEGVRPRAAPAHGLRRRGRGARRPRARPLGQGAGAGRALEQIGLTRIGRQSPFSPCGRRWPRSGRMRGRRDFDG